MPRKRILTTMTESQDLDARARSKHEHQPGGAGILSHVCPVAAKKKGQGMGRRDKQELTPPA
jgi:hypothetical protein